YLLTGRHARVSFDLADESDTRGFIFARVEEGRFDERGEWMLERIWNGDQPDYGQFHNAAAAGEGAAGDILIGNGAALDSRRLGVTSIQQCATGLLLGAFALVLNACTN